MQTVRGISRNRDFVETVLDRAQFLDGPQRALLEQVLGRGVAPRQVAAVTGCSCRTVQRRVQQLVDRLSDPAVLHILRHHRRWDRPIRQVALAVFVRHRTLRQTAEDLDMSLHAVRQHVQTVRGLIQAQRHEGETGE